MDGLKNTVTTGLRWLEKYTKTDMVYLAKGSFWLNANTVILSVFSFILSILFAKYLSKEVYGTYQFLISVSSILGALTLIGMNTAVTQAVARGFEGVFQTSVKLQIKYGLVAFGAGMLTSLYYFLNGNPTLSVAVVLIAIFLPITNAFNTWNAFLTGKKEFESSFYYNQVTNFAYYLLMIGAVIYVDNVILLIALNFIVNTITNFFIYKSVVNKYKPNTTNEEEAIDYGKKLSWSSIIPMLALSIDNLAIFHFLGAKELAIYAFSSNIPERFGSLLRPISTLSFPKFAEKNPEEVNKTIVNKTWKLFLLACIGWVIYFLLSPFLFKVFFPEYIDSIFFSQIYALSIVISIAASLPVTAIFAKRSSKIFNFNIVNPVVNVVLIWTLVYYLGIWGAIYGRIVGNVFYLFYGLYLARK